MLINRFHESRKDYLILLVSWSISLIIDCIWISKHNLPPAWDQSSHLSSAFEAARLFSSPEYLSSEWWNTLWSKFPSYRGPFTYLVSIPIIHFFGASYKSAMLTNQLFSLILIFSTYYLGRIIYNRNTGLWASFLCLISPAFLAQRTDYLIDLSLVAFLTLSWLLICIWRFDIYLNRWLSSILAGFFVGIVFLVRPTGLIFFWLPFLIVLQKIFINFFKLKFAILIQFLIGFLAGFTIVWPWFSQNWLTILLSINKARQWGLRYQEGLELNSLEGWLYYPFALPSAIGILFFGLLCSGLFLAVITDILIKKKSFTFKSNNIFWFLSFPLGGIFVCIVMSTKDLRFFLPLLPQIFIGIGILITSIHTNWSNKWKITLVMAAFSGVMWNQFGLGFNSIGLPPHLPISSEKWPLQKIIGTIRTKSPNQLSTLAVLADSKRLNAFNLDAEGKSQNHLVAARQTYFQSNDLIDELRNFDWFLLKTGDKGIMSGEREREIGNLISKSDSFVIENQWNLPDGSEAKLFRRDPLSLEVKRIDCSENSPLVNLNSISDGFELNISGEVRKLNGAKSLIQLHNKKDKFNLDQSVAQGMLRTNKLDPKSCLNIVQRLSNPNTNLKISSNAKDYENFNVDFQLIDKYGNSEKLLVNSDNILTIKNISNNINLLAINRINSVYQMSRMLRRGEISDLFAKVGQINQGDPEQIYLKDAQDIIIKRLEIENNNLDNLYALALVQVLQKKAEAASKTFENISAIDNENQYAFIAKSIVDIYRFKPKLAQYSLYKAARVNNNIKSDNIYQTIEIASNLLQFNIIKAFNLSQE